MNTTKPTQNKAPKRNAKDKAILSVTISTIPTPQRPALDHVKVGALFASPRWLDAERNHPQDRKDSHFFPAGTLANITTGVTTDVFKAFSPVSEHPQMTWIDTMNGREGVGAVSLVSHVLKVSEAEAAYRLLRMACIKNKACNFADFLAEKAA